MPVMVELTFKLMSAFKLSLLSVILLLIESSLMYLYTVTYTGVTSLSSC